MILSSKRKPFIEVYIFRFLKNEELEVEIMAIRGKKDKLAVRPTEGKQGEIIQRRPYDLWTDMDQLFDQFRTNLDDLFWRPRSAFLSAFDEQRTPMMDVADLGNKYEMKVDMPGIPKDNINIDVSPTGIEISAKQETTQDEKNKNWLRRERSSMSFYRSVEFPDKIKTNTVEAELKDGVLILSLPKAEPRPEFKATKVKIK
jgi:HSP20 family protein